MHCNYLWQIFLQTDSNIEPTGTLRFNQAAHYRQHNPLVPLATLLSANCSLNLSAAHKAKKAQVLRPTLVSVNVCCRSDF